jgi:hypothetical protein
MARMGDLLARIAETPLQFPEVVSGYFSIGSDEVRVHAVLHLHRDPAHWQDRLSRGSG